jgi:hypothetical protein
MTAALGSGRTPLNWVEEQVLVFLAHHFDDWTSRFQYFSTMMDELGLNHRQVRRACRRLAKQGFAELSDGLFNNEDGLLAGRGYGCTRAGVTMANLLKERERNGQEMESGRPKGKIASRVGDPGGTKDRCQTDKQGNQI